MAQLGDKLDRKEGREGKGGVKDKAPVSGSNTQTDDGAVLCDGDPMQKSGLGGERRTSL